MWVFRLKMGRRRTEQVQGGVVVGVTENIEWEHNCLFLFIFAFRPLWICYLEVPSSPCGEQIIRGQKLGDGSQWALFSFNHHLDVSSSPLPPQSPRIILMERGWGEKEPGGRWLNMSRLVSFLHLPTLFYWLVSGTTCHNSFLPLVSIISFNRHCAPVWFCDQIIRRDSFQNSFHFFPGL